MKQVQKKSHRVEKTNALIQKLLGEIVQPYLDTSGLVTISKVETSGDMRWTKVWVSIFGIEDEAVLKNLERNIYAIQGELNRRLMMKITPRIKFLVDTSPRYAEHITELINTIHAEDTE